MSETIADILREMERYAESLHDAWLGDPNTFSGYDTIAEELAKLADHIEAAYKREMDEMEVLANSPTDLIFIDDPQTEVITEESNAAKLREACEIIARTELPPNRHVTEAGEVVTYADGNRWLGMMRTGVALAKAALAAPPRNCDVGTAEEQSERFVKFCGPRVRCKSCPIFDRGYDCKFLWAQMPYEAKEGANDGKW